MPAVEVTLRFESEDEMLQYFGPRDSKNVTAVAQSSDTQNSSDGQNDREADAEQPAKSTKGLSKKKASVRKKAAAKKQAKEQPADDTAAEAQPVEQDSYSLDDVKQAVGKVNTTFGLKKARDVLQEFNAEKISKLQESDYAAVVQRCNEVVAESSEG